MKIILDEIENDIKDVISTKFVYNNTNVVPNSSDPALTYESGIEKKGKTINTCVLFVDIRNSVALTEKHHNETMGKIYTAFTKAVLKVARYHHGHTRNIIGDRVMIIFPTENCFTHAVECATSINHIAIKIIKKNFINVDFKCGIGIDYGEMRVIKVGIQRQGTESNENKGLVWVGYPANMASRLTDNANKSFEETYFRVDINPFNSRSIKPLNLFPVFGSNKLGVADYLFPSYDPSAPRYLSKRTVQKTIDEFTKNITLYNGELFMGLDKMISFSKDTRKIIYPSILITADVFNGLKKESPNSGLIRCFNVQSNQIKNVNGEIYGGDFTWNIKQ